MADASVELGALAKEFYSVWFRCRPDAALVAGVGGYEGLLPVQDDDEVSALVGWLETLVLALEDVDLAALQPQDRLDWFLMQTSARFEHEVLRRRDRWRDPSDFLPVAEVYRLTLTPTETMGERLAALLAGIPEYLRHAQGRLREGASEMPALLVRVAAQEAEAGRCHIRSLIHGSWLRRHWAGISELESLAEAACDALSDFRACMVSEVLPRALGALGCGGEGLAARLAGVHYLDCDPAALHPVLDATAATNDEALRALADATGEPVQVLLQRAAAQTLTGDAWVEAHARICERLADEIAGSALVELPVADLKLGVRPACPRPQAFRADYLADGRASGTLFLADPSDSVDGEPVESIRARCLDKGWGGSHLITFSAPEVSRRLPRLAADGVSLVKGWSLYIGYRLACAGDAAAERRAWTLERRRREIELARLDLAVHRQGLGEEEALAALQTVGLGADAEPALARLVAHPGDALAGVLGWLLIEEARRLSEAESGSAFDQRELHRRVLGQGEIPMALTLCFGLGKPLWERVREGVLGA